MRDTVIAELDIFFSPYRSILPEVTLRIGDWLFKYSQRNCSSRLGCDHRHGRTHGLLGRESLADSD